jgi:hypothetical protein
MGTAMNNTTNTTKIGENIAEAPAPSEAEVPKTKRKPALRQFTDVTKRRLVRELIEQARARVKLGQERGALSDLIRLLQMERELAPPARPKKLTITWVDPETGEPWGN